MHRRKRQTPLIAAAAVVLVLCLLSSSLPPAQAATGPASQDAPDDFARLLDQRMPGLLQKYGVPGTVVSAIRDGDVVWSRAYGVADSSTGQAMRPDMLLEHGSDGKAATAWAVMVLVEAGKIDLDAPVNQYLKRWQVPSSGAGDASQVTARRLLSHTSGLNIHGYVDFSPRRARLPGLVDMLTGPHLGEGLSELATAGRLSTGRAEILQRPGSGYLYSGAAYTVLQLLIEDVSGEPFDTFVQREVTDPLGATGMRWEWTPELRANAARPHGNEGQVLEYRQLANHAIGSEIATAADFARFLAAAVPGPNGEPAGRGVLRPETVELMTTAHPETGGLYGLGYGIATNYGQPAVSHSGSNTGWVALYFLDKTRRLGFVVASNSSRAGTLHSAILNLWSSASFGQALREFPPEPRYDSAAVVTFALAGLLAVALLISVAVFVWQLSTGRRGNGRRPSAGGLLAAAPWLLWLVFIWYTSYSALPLYLPGGFMDFWPSPAVATLAGVLLAWLAFRLVAAFYPRALPAENRVKTARPAATEGTL